MSNINPKVSICIPTYNQTDYLKKTLDSILNQDFNDYEIIVTDDSTNNSVENLIKEHSIKDKIKYLKNEKSLGSPENWNKAISLASGEYIKILHHDDWFSEKKSLGTYINLLDENPDVSFAFSASNACGKNGEILFTHRATNYQLEKLRKIPDLLFLGNFIGSPSATIHRRNHIKYDNKLMWLVDVDFYVKNLSENKKFAYSDEPLVMVTSDGDHQVTKYCERNSSIDISESFYLYPKIKNKIVKTKYTILLIKKVYDQKIKGRSVKDILKKLLLKTKIITDHKKTSYSQCGEDLIISFIFKQLKQNKISYLDLGAHHPININNTYLFYKNGSSGVNVEPDFILHKYIKQKRKRDVCLNIGVGTEHKKDSFFVMSSKTLNTFSKKDAYEMVKNNGQKIERVIDIQLETINDIISNYFKDQCPDFVSIDIEGLDYEILKSLDFKKYRPKVFCVETITYTENGTENKIKDIIDLMENNGYFSYADTYINTIFVEKNIWKKRNN